MKSIIQLATLALAMLVLSGCSLLAPNRDDPTVNIPLTWNESGLMAANNLPYIAWWNKFNDENLNALIESSLIRNTSIAEAKANIQQAQGELRSVELSWIPGITAMAGQLNMIPMFPQPQSLYGAYVGYASINIFSIIAQQKAAKLNLEAQQKSLEGVKLDLISNVAISYYTLIAQQNELVLYQQYLRDLELKVKFQHSRRQGGLSNEAAGLSLQQNIHQAQTQLKAIENNLIKSQNALNYLLNDNPGKKYPLSDFATSATSYANLYSLPATLIGNRPDIAVAALQYKYAAQNKTVAYTQLLPSFQLLFGPAETTGGGFPGVPDALYNNYQSQFVTWSLSPAVFGDIENYTGQEKYYYVNYIDTVRKALRDVSNDLATNRLANERYWLTKEAESDAKHQYELTSAMYNNGLKSYADTCDGKTNLDEAAIGVNQMKLAQMQAIITLYKDLAGGYRYNESANP